MDQLQIFNIENSPNIDVYPFNLVTENTPNSKYPILVYRNVINQDLIEKYSEEEYQNLLNVALMKNGWSALGTFGTFTTTHYHPNVHECYAITKGHSKYFLGLDVRLTPEEMKEEGLNTLPEHLEITINKGDILIVPAGVSHCSQVKDKGFRYVASYPVNGDQWKGISKDEVEKAGGKYDNTRDIEMVKNVPFPLGDPVYGVAENSLIDIWKKV